MPHRVFITGVAGFIGMHTAKNLLDLGYQVFGIDNLNNYYAVSLKESRLNQIKDHVNFTFKKCDLNDQELLINIFKEFKPDYVINLAAQAGVRYSLENPHAYISTNIQGFLNILETCRIYPVKHLVYASSSSVYGLNKKIPFNEADGVDHPISLYATSKRSNELMAHTYSHLFNIPTTGLRFFTVYGPWGRPDMALFLFTKAILDGQSIKVFNHGNMIRDFTYVDDIVEGITKLMMKPPKGKKINDTSCLYPNESNAPFKIFNIGNSSPVQLKKYISALEHAIGRKAIKDFQGMQPGDVQETHSDCSNLEHWINFSPSTEVEVGIKNFFEWYKSYYQLS
jgi:UDP-glucuronate 4-epimerase